MIHKNFIPIVFVCSLIAVFVQAQTSAPNGEKDDAYRALKANRFSEAISICLNGLEKNPGDYEFQFCLARAYAFSEQWDMADEVIDDILKNNPKNLDVLLLRARIQAWRKNYSDAEKGFKRVLSLDQNNVEALVGLADIAHWQGDLREAEIIYLEVLEAFPERAEMHYKLGLLYRNMGNYGKATEHITNAVELSPDTREYTDALKNIHTAFEKKFELRYQRNIQAFNDDRKDYIDNQFILCLNNPDLQTSMLFWVDQTKRFGKGDHQFKLEIYPSLWSKAYGHFYITYSPKSVHYPAFSYLAEIYQVFLSALEVSLAYRRMSFKENPVSIYSGSVGYYWNQFYSWLRLYFLPDEKGSSLSWTANIRRYFSIDDYIFIGFGMGSQPFEIMTIEDLWTGKIKIFVAGFHFVILKNLRIQFFYSHQSEKDGLKRNSFSIASGIRF